MGLGFLFHLTQFSESEKWNNNKNLFLRSLSKNL